MKTEIERERGGERVNLKENYILQYARIVKEMFGYDKGQL